MKKSKPEVFIIESLGLDDEENETVSGIFHYSRNDKMRRFSKFYIGVSEEKSRTIICTQGERNGDKYL